jgi:hypothetical protein
MSRKITLTEVRKADYIGLPGEKGMYSRLTIPDGWLEVAYEVWEGSHSRLHWVQAPATKRVRREAFKRVFYRELREALGKLRDDGGYLKVVEKHSGRMPFNGGEYGFWREYTPLPGGKWRVEYFTTADFHYCKGCGNFHEPPDCDPEEVTEAEILEEIKFENLPPSDQQGRWWREEWEGDKLVLVKIDQTGHDYEACQFDGGCCRCYPCNHPGCCSDD